MHNYFINFVEGLLPVVLTVVSGILFARFSTVEHITVDYMKTSKKNARYYSRDYFNRVREAHCGYISLHEYVITIPLAMEL